MNAHGFERGAGSLALVGAALWAATGLGSAVVADDPPSTATQMLLSLAFLLPLVAVPALGGVWLLRRHHRRTQAGAGLVAAAGLLVTATVPALLVRVFVLPATWQLLGVAAVLVLALAGGFAAAALLRNPEVQWSFPFSRHGGVVARVPLLASIVALAVTMQPRLRESLAQTFRHGLQSGLAELHAIPPSVQGLILTGFVAVAAAGMGAAMLRPPQVAAAVGAAVAVYALVDVVHATAAADASAWFWLHTTAVAVLAVDVAVLTGPRAPHAVGIPAAEPAPARYAELSWGQVDPLP